LRLFTRRPNETGSRVRLFFASDIHGSDRCWKKFLAAGEVHQCEILVMGGDITAKAIVPVLRNGSGYNIRVGGRTEHLSTEAERQRFEQALRDQGFYTIILDADEEIDEERQGLLYEQLARETLSRWLEMAERRIAGSGKRLLLLPGNDDIRGIDSLIGETDWLLNPEGQVVELSAEHELIATGVANPTPWNTPREVPEEELTSLLEQMVKGVRDVSRLVLIAHVPPHDTVIDQAPKLVRKDGELAIDRRGGQAVMVSVGSVAVRKFIEKHQPLIALHGHIHESRGIIRIGRTTCVNPGSEYPSGDVSGVIVELRSERISQCQLITA